MRKRAWGVSTRKRLPATVSVVPKRRSRGAVNIHSTRIGRFSFMIVTLGHIRCGLAESPGLIGRPQQDSLMV